MRDVKNATTFFYSNFVTYFLITENFILYVDIYYLISLQNQLVVVNSLVNIKIGYIFEIKHIHNERERNRIAPWDY